MSESEATPETPKAKPKLLQARTWVPVVKDYEQMKKEGVLEFKDAQDKHPLAVSQFVPSPPPPAFFFSFWLCMLLFYHVYFFPSFC